MTTTEKKGDGPFLEMTLEDKFEMRRYLMSMEGMPREELQKFAQGLVTALIAERVAKRWVLQELLKHCDERGKNMPSQLHVVVD